MPLTRLAGQLFLAMDVDDRFGHALDGADNRRAAKLGDLGPRRGPADDERQPTERSDSKGRRAARPRVQQV